MGGQSGFVGRNSVAYCAALGMPTLHGRKTETAD
jgi:hypothetical protein